MATFQQDPLDLQTSDVKYYLGKITGAGNIGSRDQGEPLKYFNPQDIGVVQSTAILQPFNTDEFKLPVTQDNTAWINFLNPANPSDTTNSTTYTVGPFSRTVTWTVGLTNRDTEVNYVTKVLSHFDDLIVGPNTFGQLFFTRIRTDLALASSSFQGTILNPDDLRDALTDIRDDDSYITESAGENTYFYRQLEKKNLFNALNSIYASSYDGAQDVIYNKGFGDFNSFMVAFNDFKNTINTNIAPIFDDTVGYLNLLKSLTPYDNVISGVIGNYQLTNTLDLTGISGYPTGYEDGKYLRSTTTGLEYVDITDPVLAFTGLSDTPSTITPNEYLRGTADGQNLIFSGVSFLEDVTDRPTVPQSGYLQRTPAGQLVWAAGTTSGDITYNFTGSDFFTGLQDTPANYDQFKFLRSALNSIEYVDINEGIVSFTGLDGTPNDFSGGKYLISSSTGIEYTDIPAPVLTFTGLTDTPSSFTNASGQYLRINSAENAVEFIDISGQINSHEIAWDTYLRFGDLPPASNHSGMFTYVMIDSLSGAYVSNGTDWVKIDSDSEEGSSSFTGLSDTPNSYDSGKYLISSATGIEYVDVVAPVVAFTGLTDTPSSYAGQSGRYLMVADAETGIEFKDPTFYTGAFVGFGGAIVFKGLDTYAPAVGWNDRKLTNLVGISGIKETYLDNEQIVLPKGKYLISAEGGVNCDSSAGANPAGKTKIGIEFTSGDYIGQTFDSFSNRGQTAGNYGQIRGSIQVAIESQNPIKFKVKSYLPTVTTPAEYSFNAAQTDVSILDLGASKDFLSFTGLLDVPNTFDGASGKYLRVSDDQTELEYVDISDTGITGAFNIGAGSGVVSGVVDQDAYFKSLVGGTNVTLSSDDSTITINAAGGGGGDSSGCCNTIKIRKNDADVPTSEMAREVISNLYFGYAQAGGYPYSYYYASLDKITDGDSNTYWQPFEGHNTYSSQWGKNVQAYINFNTDIYINSIEWEGDPWYGKVQKIQSSSGTLWQRSSNNQYGVTPFTTDDINQSSTSALVGKAYQIKQGWSTITTDPNAVPSYDFSNLPAGGKLNQIYWSNPYSQTNNNAGMPFVSLVGNGRQGRYPTIKNIKLAYALTDPSVPNYIVQRPFAGGISASTNATIYLQRGQSYTFEVESAGNPFYIKTANVGGTSDLFSAGVTNNGVGDGDLTFQVPYDAPETLYYVSSNVPTLSGMIKILAADGGSFSSSGVTDVSNVGAGSGVASGVVDNTGYFKSLIGGTNLEILGDENSLTLNVTGISAGGGAAGEGGIGSKAEFANCNFTGQLPDFIYQQDNAGVEYALSLSVISTAVFRYECNTAGTNRILSFGNNTSGGPMSNPGTWTLGGNSPGPVSIQWYIDNDQALYLGGGSSAGGGAGLNTGVLNRSNFGSIIPDQILLTSTHPSALDNEVDIAYFHRINDDQIMYQMWTDGQGADSYYLWFANDVSGTNPVISGPSYYEFFPGDSNLQDVIDNGHAIYLGGGSSSSSSTSGITGVESLGAGSALASGISESDLMLKSLVGGANITLSSDDSTITINAAGGSSSSGSSTLSYETKTLSADFSHNTPPYAAELTGLAFDNLESGKDYLVSAYFRLETENSANDFVQAQVNHGNDLLFKFPLHADGARAWGTPAASKFITATGDLTVWGGSLDGNSKILAGSYLQVADLGAGGGSSSSSSCSGSGGAGSNPFVTGASDFYTFLPDQLILNNNGGSPVVYGLDTIGANWIYYLFDEKYLKFNQNAEGTFDSNGWSSHTPDLSLSGFIDSGRAVYFGGCGSSAGGGSAASSSATTECSGGAFSNQDIKGAFAGDFTLPDAIVVPITRGGGDQLRIFHLNGFYGGTISNPTNIQYEWIIGDEERYTLQFENDIGGTFVLFYSLDSGGSPSSTTSVQWSEIQSVINDEPTLKEFIDDNKAIYYGGCGSSSGSSSSSGGSSSVILPSGSILQKVHDDFGAMADVAGVGTELCSLDITPKASDSILVCTFNCLYSEDINSAQQGRFHKDGAVFGGFWYNLSSDNYARTTSTLIAETTADDLNTKAISMRITYDNLSRVDYSSIYMTIEEIAQSDYELAGGSSSNGSSLYQTYLDKNSKIEVDRLTNSPVGPNSYLTLFDYNSDKPIYIYGGTYQNSFSWNPEITIDGVIVSDDEGLIVGQDQGDDDISIVHIPPLYATGQVFIRMFNDSATTQEVGGYVTYSTGNDIQTIDAQGGGSSSASSSSGGVGLSEEVLARSNFGSTIPDAIQLDPGDEEPVTFVFRHIGDGAMQFYDVRGNETRIRFNNDLTGTKLDDNTAYERYQGDVTLQDIIDNGHAIYYGGSSSAGGGGGGGSSDFTGLSDTPNSYDSGKYLQSSTTGLDWVDAPTGGLVNWTETNGHILPNITESYDIGSADYKVRHLFLSDSSLKFVDASDNITSINSSSFTITGLSDTFNSYDDCSGKYLRVNKNEDGVEFTPLDLGDSDLDFTVDSTNVQFIEKRLNTNIKSDQTISDFTFPNLIVGKTYRVSATLSFYSESETNLVQAEIYNGANKLVTLSNKGRSTTASASMLFIAAHDTVTVEGKNLSTIDYILGDPTISIVQLELPPSAIVSVDSQPINPGVPPASGIFTIGDVNVHASINDFQNHSNELSGISDGIFAGNIIQAANINSTINIQDITTENTFEDIDGNLTSFGVINIADMKVNTIIRHTGDQDLSNQAPFNDHSLSLTGIV